MPTFDADRGVLVLRLVYDGAPRSGKTTTLRALAEALKVELVSPAERDGRTLFFDWLEYVGGRFEGHPIRCQAISVPGQIELAARRRELLAEADAIVLVADSGDAGLDRALALLRDLGPLHRLADPPVGVVLQANKRDAPDAAPREIIDERVRAVAPIAVVETVATSGDGVREAFAMAVRLALDRVRALADTGRIPRGLPAHDNPEALLASLRALDERAPAGPIGPAALAPSSARAAVPAPAAEGPRPFALDPAMPGGSIWPPVEGRTLMHEAAQKGLTPAPTRSGDWSASAAGWRLHSAAGAVFDAPEAAHDALRAWARVHAKLQPVLSGGRAILVAEAGGHCRLWQLVRVTPSLREVLADAADASPERVAEVLAFAAEHLARARDRLWLCAPELGLRCGLWTIGGDARQLPRYVGLVPARAGDAPDLLETGALLRRELAPYLRGLAAQRADYGDVVAALQRHPSGPATVELLAMTRDPATSIGARDPRARGDDGDP